MAVSNIEDLIQSFLKKNKKTTLFHEQNVVKIWNEEMGDFIKNNTESVSMKNGILFVKLSNASLKFELLGSRSTIIAKLNKVMGVDVVKDIIIR